MYSGRKLLKICYMVMQDVDHQLFTDSVTAEVCLSMKDEDSLFVDTVQENFLRVPLKNALKRENEINVSIAASSSSFSLKWVFRGSLNGRGVRFGAEPQRVHQ